MSHLTPLLVRTFGRTGSTLLMQVFGTGANVCFERQYPFEQRYLTYVHELSRVIGLPEKSNEQWNNDMLFSGRSDVVGSLPYHDVKALDRALLSDLSYVALWEQFSEAMRHERGMESGEPGFYAEKVPHHVVDRANEHLKARNVFLLRDPRDELVSIKSFNAKRGFNGFGWCPEDTDLSYARKMCGNRRVFLRNLVGFDTNPRRIAVRYEDLIRKGPEEVERLSDWLGIRLSHAEATGDRAIKKQHMTSKDPASSVERWRTELDDEVQALFAEEIGDELSTLGYRV